MKTATIITIGAGVAALAGVAYLIARRSSSGSAAPGSGGSLLDGLALGGTAQNQSLFGPYNFGGDSVYNLQPAVGYDLSGQGQGSGGFFSRLLQPSVTP